MALSSVVYFFYYLIGMSFDRLLDDVWWFNGDPEDHVGEPMLEGLAPIDASRARFREFGFAERDEAVKERLANLLTLIFETVHVGGWVGGQKGECRFGMIPGTGLIARSCLSEWFETPFCTVALRRPRRRIALPWWDMPTSSFISRGNGLKTSVRWPWK